MNFPSNLNHSKNSKWSEVGCMAWFNYGYIHPRAIRDGHWMINDWDVQVIHDFFFSKHEHVFPFLTISHHMDGAGSWNYPTWKPRTSSLYLVKTVIILGVSSANERRRYIVTSSLIGWTHTQNDPINTMFADISGLSMYTQDWSRLAPSQWKTPLQCNAISHWLDTSLESALYTHGGLEYVHTHYTEYVCTDGQRYVLPIRWRMYKTNGWITICIISLRWTGMVANDMIYCRADSRIAPNQWEMSLQSNAFSHWLGANLDWEWHDILHHAFFTIYCQ